MITQHILEYKTHMQHTLSLVAPVINIRAGITAAGSSYVSTIQTV